MTSVIFLVKFGLVKDREMIFNVSPWLFDQCLFVMVPFIKGPDASSYIFHLVPFWILIYNVSFEWMGR